jgi:hypothetical protein
MAELLPLPPLPALDPSLDKVAVDLLARLLRMSTDFREILDREAFIPVEDELLLLLKELSFLLTFDELLPMELLLRRLEPPEPPGPMEIVLRAPCTGEKKLCGRPRGCGV